MPSSNEIPPALPDGGLDKKIEDLVSGYKGTLNTQLQGAIASIDARPTSEPTPPAGDTLHATVNIPDAKADADDGQVTGKAMKGRRRAQTPPPTPSSKPRNTATNPANVSSAATPADPAVDASLASGTADATVVTATVDNNEPKIDLGKYRDSDGVLCDVSMENGMYRIVTLEGKDTGDEAIIKDAKEMQTVMGGKWEKVAEATLPTVNPNITPDPTVVPQAPATPPQTAPAPPQVPPAPAPSVTTPKAPNVPKPPSLKEQKRLEKEAKREKAMRDLLKKLGGQKEFVLVNRKGSKTECQIDDLGVIRIKGEDEKKTDWVIDKLTLVTPWEVRVKNVQAPASAGPATPATPAALNTAKSPDAATPGAGEKEPIVLGWYRDEQGFLCNLFKDGGDYSYTIHEGPNRGETLTQSDVFLRSLIRNKWEKVDGASLLTVDTTDKISLLEKGKIYDFQGNRGPINRLVRADEGYYFVDIDGARVGDQTFYSTEETIQKLVDDEKWELVAVDGVPVTVEKEKIKLPENPGEKVYFDTLHGQISAEFEPISGTYMFDFDRTGLSDEDKMAMEWVVALLESKPRDEIVEQATREGWKEIDASAMAPKTPNVAPATPPTVDSSIDRSRFTPLQKGEQAYYSGKEGPVTVTGLGGSWYRLLHPSRTSAGLECGEDSVHYYANEEEWVLDAMPPVMPPAPDASLGAGKKRVELLIGPTAFYTTGDPLFPTKRIQRVNEDLYRDLDSKKEYLGSEIEALALAENWEKAETPDPAQPTEAEKLKEKMDDLLTMVNEARFQYVTADFKQNSVWKKLKGIFGKNVSENSGDPDTKTTREGYELALTRYYDAKLGNLKASGLSQKEISKEMGGMLMYLKHNERINLAEDTLRVQAENKKFPGKVTDFFENIGKSYNKLTPAKKIAIAIGVLGASAIVGVTGGVAGAAVGAGMMGARRAIATLGAGVSMDMLTAQGTEYLRKRSATKEQEEEMAVLKKLATPTYSPDDQNILREDTTSHEEVYSKLNEFLAKDIKQLDAKFKSQKREKLWRRTLVWTTALGASSYFTYKAFLGGATSGGAGEPSTDAEARAINQLRSPAGAASAVGSGAGAPSALSMEPAPGPSFSSVSSPNGPKPMGTLNLGGASGIRPDQVIVTPGGAESATSAPDSTPTYPHSSEYGRDSVVDSRATPPTYPHSSDYGRDSVLDSRATPLSAESMARVAALREDYTVTTADGKKGLWGVLERRLEGMPKADQNRAIATIQELMRRDLALMSSAERVEAGFAEGKLDLIHKDDVIRFDKFPSLTAERLAAAMDGQSVGAPNGVADVIDRPIGPANGISPINQTIVDEGGMRESDRGIPVSPMEHAINEETITRLADQPMVAPDTTEAVQEQNWGETPAQPSAGAIQAETASAVTRGLEMSPMELANPANLVAYMADHPELSRSYRLTLSDIKTDIFSMGPDVIPQNGPYMARIDGGYQIGIHGGVVMDRVLETERDLRTGEITPYEYDRRDFPFKSTQVDRLAHLVRISCHPRIFGEAGRVLPGERVDAYLKRIATLATVSNKEREIGYLLGNRR